MTPDGLVAELVLHEPSVRQPVFIQFDERGRLWVVQYLQYPHPAGLRMVSRDQYWRAVYDKVPPPPPHHFRGEDRITIHEDTDGDGEFDTSKVFVEGLNIVTAVEQGRGGVWVLNPPYLLFYPDRDRDDVPDGDPEVRLEGFGLEDTHSVVNSLTWGPDGWLYAAQGSTVTGRVRRPNVEEAPRHSMGQLIWRYHPETRRYEVFAEGGGNAFGVEIDARGNTFSGHNGGDTRGFHYVQGGYYQKGFSKHGPLSNPHAFGYFPAMRHHSVERFTHTFVIYEGGALPEEWNGRLFGVAPLLRHVVVSAVSGHGSTFQTKDLTHALTTTDPWFRPVDIELGPDGALWIADWHDDQVNHYRNHEGRIDKSTGRVWRLRGERAPVVERFDLATESTDALIRRLAHPNRWMRRTALRVLGDRKDRASTPALLRLLDDERGQLALEALWALEVSGGVPAEASRRALSHANPDVRRWAARLLGDRREVTPQSLDALVERAEVEDDVSVRSQLASTARRLRPRDGLRIVEKLLARSEDAKDPHLPLLLWWTIETHLSADVDAVLALFARASVWRLPIVEGAIVERLARRLGAGDRAELIACARLIDLAPDAKLAARAIQGFELAARGRSLASLPEPLIEAIERRGGGSLALRVRRGDEEALAAALALLAAPDGPDDERVRIAEVLGELATPSALQPLLDIVDSTESSDALRIAAVGALEAYSDASIGEFVVLVLSDLPAAVRPAALGLLGSRAEWTRELITAVEEGDVSPDAVEREDLEPLLVRLRGSGLGEQAAEAFALEATPDRGRLEAEIGSWKDALAEDAGDPYRGKPLFRRVCARCHTLFGEGGRVGPDLTTHPRDDIDSLLLAIVIPDAEIREGFETRVAVTTDGRLVTGFLEDEDERVVVLRTVDGKSTTLERKRLAELRAVGSSLMPGGLLGGLSPAAVRDLFAYLRSTQPLND